MTEKTQLFQFAGERPAEKTEAEKKKKWYQDRPVAAELFLGLLVLGCLFCGQIMTKDPSYMDLKNCSVMPCREFLFGTLHPSLHGAACRKNPQDGHEIRSLV